MTRNKKRRLDIIFGSLIGCFLFGLCGILVQQANRQQQLDQKLIAAIKPESLQRQFNPERLDLAQIKSLLAQGANPNLQVPLHPEVYERYHRCSFWEQLLHLFQGKPREAGYETVPLTHVIAGRGGSCFGVFINANDGAIIQALVEAGADPNAAREDGTTLLMTVVSVDGDTQTLLPFLIAQGADVNAQNRAGWTARKYAEKYAEIGADRRSIEILRQAGAK